MWCCRRQSLSLLLIDILFMRTAFTIFILYFLSLSSTLVSQRQVTTLSGQRIIIFQSGEWQKIEAGDESGDTLGMLSGSDSVFQNPNVSGNIDTTNVNIGIGLITEAAQKKEIETLLLLDLLDKQVAVKEVQLSHARQLKNKESEKQLKAELTDLKQKFKTAEKIYKFSAENVEKAFSLKKMKENEYNKNLSELGKVLDIDVIPYLDTQKSKSILEEDTRPLKNTRIGGTTKKEKCLIVRDEKVKKERIIELGYEPFFTFTPEKLKNYFKNKELVEVNASVKKKGKQNFLRMSIKIVSKDAARNYGFIPHESILRISFISGKVIVLKSTEEVQGFTEKYTGNIVYNVDYQIKSEDYSQIAKVPIDTVGIMWSSGFEIYDIYNVDLLINHCSCINSL